MKSQMAKIRTWYILMEALWWWHFARWREQATIMTHHTGHDDESEGKYF